MVGVSGGGGERRARQQAQQGTACLYVKMLYGSESSLSIKPMTCATSTTGEGRPHHWQFEHRQRCLAQRHNVGAAKQLHSGRRQWPLPHTRMRRSPWRGRARPCTATGKHVEPSRLTGRQQRQAGGRADGGERQGDRQVDHHRSAPGEQGRTCRYHTISSSADEETGDAMAMPRPALQED